MEAVRITSMSQAQADQESRYTLLNLKACFHCRRTFSHNLMAELAGQWVCAECKPRRVQLMIEGAIERFESPNQSATFLARSGTMVGSLLLAFMILLICTAVNSIWVRDFSHDFTDIRISPLVLALSVSATFLYEAISIVLRGQTTPQILVGLRVVSSGGLPVGLAQAALRTFVNFLVFPILGVGHLMILFDTQKRSLADLLCGTRVEYVRK